MNRHSGYRLLEIEEAGLSAGIKYGGDDRLSRTARIWPHTSDGDGHYCALLKKDVKSDNKHTVIADNTSSAAYAAVQDWLRWADNVLSPEGMNEMKLIICQWHPRLHNDHLQLLPPETPAFARLKMVKTGFYLGHYKSTGKPEERSKKPAAAGKNRQRQIFEPAHAWFTAMKADDFAFTLRLEPDDESLYRYLRGETIGVDNNLIVSKADRSVRSGDIVVICLKDHPLGYAKMQQGTLKNMYPAAWRLRT
jgi:NOL1/NOP2/fmu family ribosome biogenesis protein